MKNSGIQWTTHTFNPWWGCQRVSPGCEHCYAETLAVTRRKLPVWGPPKTTDRKVTGEGYWQEPKRWNRAAAKSGERPRVFPSMCDPFEEHPQLVLPRRAFFRLIEETPNLWWLLLTKRPENVMGMVPEGWRGKLPENVAVGISAETQEWYERRLSHLARIPARMRFVSAEPLLGPIDFGLLGAVPADWGVGFLPAHSFVDWIIFGGESGHGARPCNVAWIRHGVRQCREASVAPFVKQLGAQPVRPPDGQYFGPAHALMSLRDPKGGDPSEWPKDLVVREFPEVLI